MKTPNQPLRVNLECVDIRRFARLFSGCFDFPRADFYFRMLVVCALVNDSLESYCNKNDRSPDRLQFYLKRISVEEIVCFALKAYEKTLEMYDRRKVFLAIDYHDEEYFGKPDSYVINTIMLHGERFCKATVHRYITMSIVDERFKHTLAVLPVLNGQKSEELVRRLLCIAKKIVDIECVLLDRGFLTVNVLDTFNDMDVQYLIPSKKGNTDIRVAYWMSVETDRWRWPHKLYKDRHISVETELFLEELVTLEYMGFLTNRYMKTDTFKELLRIYDKRWNIENGYKEAKTYRIRTSSKNQVYRLLIQVIGHILVNLLQIVRHTRIKIRGYEMNQVFLHMLKTKTNKETIRISKRLYITIKPPT